MSFGKLGAMGRGFGHLGALGRAGTSGGVAPTAPTLALDSEIAGLMAFIWGIGATVSTGDTLTRQVATDIGFSTILETLPHVITSGEDTADQITTDQYQAPANGTYYVRGTVTSVATGLTSSASNILTVVVADMSSAYGFLWGTDNILWSTDHMIWS